MKLNHIGITSRSAELSDRFYRDFLGFTDIKRSVLPADLASQIFSVSQDIDMITYAKGEIRIEVFICPECSQPSPDFRHIGLYVDDLNSVIDKAEEYGIENTVGKKGDKVVHFLKDLSGNLVEIKQG